MSARALEMQAMAPPEPAGPILVASRKELRRLASELRSPEREHAIVVLSLVHRSERPPFEPQALCAALGPEVLLYLLPSTYMARRLADAIGPELAVADGCVRIFWGGAGPECETAAHPLVRVEEGEEPERALERLLGVFELSRPQIRRHVQPIRQRLAAVERQADQSLREQREAREQRDGALRRAQGAEAALARAEMRLEALQAAGIDESELSMLGGMDSEQKMHRLIAMQWICALSAQDRLVHPLGRYLFGPRFIESVEPHATAIERIAFVCAMVSCSRARSMRGIDPHPLRTDEGGAAPQELRADGAKGFTCKVREGQGALRLRYWVTSEGLVEFSSVGLHDEIGRA